LENNTLDELSDLFDKFNLICTEYLNPTIDKISMEKKMYLNKKLITQFEFSEIDFDLHDEFKFDYDRYEELVIDSDNDYSNYPIKIERVIDYLNEIKGKGVTHVSFDYHVDHIGYIIEGYKITPMNNEDIEKYNIRYKKIKELEDEYRKKQKEMDDLLNKIRKF